MDETVLEFVILVDTQVGVRGRLGIVGVALFPVGLKRLGKHDDDGGRIILLPDHAPDVRPGLGLGSLGCDVLEGCLGLGRHKVYGRGVDVVKVALRDGEMDSVGLVWVDIGVAVAEGVLLAAAACPLGRLL